MSETNQSSETSSFVGYQRPSVEDKPVNERRGVIWGYGPAFAHCQAELDAEAKLRELGVRSIVNKADAYYGDEDTIKIERCDYCVTSNEYIKEDYEKAGITVMELGPLTEEELKNVHVKTVIETNNVGDLVGELTKALRAGAPAESAEQNDAIQKQLADVQKQLKQAQSDLKAKNIELEAATDKKPVAKAS